MPGRTVSRRRVVGLLGGGVVLAPAIARALSERALVASGASFASPADDLPAANTFDASSLVAPLRPGSKLNQWTVASVGSLDEGAVTVALEGDDWHGFRLEILARDASPIAPRPP